MCHLLKKVLGWFGVRMECGELLLVVTGPKEVEVKLDFTPKQVWLNMSPSCCIPVCQGDVDAFDVRLIPHGFVISVRLTSEFREVEWIAVK